MPKPGDCHRYLRPKITCACSVWLGCRVVCTVVPPVRGQDSQVHLFHAVCRSRVFHNCVSGVVSYSDGTQAFGYDRWNRRLVCWSWE